MKLVQCRWPALTSPLGEIAHPPGQPSRPVSGMGQLDLGVEPPPRLTTIQLLTHDPRPSRNFPAPRAACLACVFVNNTIRISSACVG